jgi:hypothetical protein
MNDTGRPRGGIGELHHFAKLTADDVRAIRARYESGDTIDAIFLWLTGQGVHVSHSLVAKVVKRRAWKHLA